MIPGHRHFSVITLCLLLAVVSNRPAAGAGALSYNRDIRPILSDNCFFCHGPDQNKRKGKMRLDVREEAVAKKAIVPGKPEESELIRRIFTHDQDDQMPPLDSPKKLSDSQKELLRSWIAEGAKYESHWAYLPPTRPTVPATSSAIDFLVQRRLQEAGLQPSIEADRRTLARRLYFDLIGLPPRPEEVEAFQNAKSPDAYVKLVDSLIASPQFGERQAIGWLDIARYADTIGYHSDTPRNVWPYRDYVINAFNENKPYDQFTREQLAGDLLPECTREQKVASAFNRLLLSTEEGGAQAKDYEARMLTDRVRAVSAIWLGQTFGCAQCHDHKFDPIKQRDFYSLGAFFADIKEPIIGRREDGMPLPDEAQTAQIARLDGESARLQKEYDGPHPELAQPLAEWEKEQWEAMAQEHRWTALTPSRIESAGGAKLTLLTNNSVLVKGKKANKDTYTVATTNALKSVIAFRIEALPDGSLPAKGPGRADNGNFVLTEVVARLERGSEVQTLRFSKARASFEQKDHAESNPSKGWTAASTIDGESEAFGWAILPEVGKAQQLVLELAEPFAMQDGDTLIFELRQNFGNGNHTLGHFRIGATSDPEAVRGILRAPPAKEIAELLAMASDQRDQTQKEKLFAHFKTFAPQLDDLRKRLADSRKAKTDFEATLPHCLVSVSSDHPREVRILPRGNFLIETGEIVKPALPGYLTVSLKPQSDRPLDRLALANWLVSRDNPLTARVAVNRLWKQFFGIGLSKVLDDFGAQGEPPQNQELLDWLACEFMESGWDLKHMIRLIVESDTYRQVSIVSKELRARDPYNRDLAAQSRWRLDAELVRDNALAISGLLERKIGGPSVNPYQPDGYWENLNFPVRTYMASTGENQYRRGLYTWWQRSYLHPSLLAFDAPTREECAAERNRSNIPQQALALLNDPSYVEASRAFAARILKEGGSDISARITWAWRQALARSPRADELETVQTLFVKHLAEYRDNKEAAQAFLHVGFQPLPPDLDASELAAWTSVARVIFNLHESITRS